MVRTIRIAAWVAIGALAIAAGLIVTGVLPGRPIQAPMAATVGGPFSLTSHTGRRIDNVSLKGKPFTVFFGFTFCPDVCPTTLSDLTNLIQDLGPEADKMGYYFITVDPSRDTQTALATYLSSFDKRIIGLIGTPDELAAVAKAYRAIYKRVDTKDGYTMDHTATMYLMDRNGLFAGTIDYQENHAAALAKLRRLAASK
jgi:protein SCO1